MKMILSYIINIWNSLAFRSKWKESLISFLLGFLLCYLISIVVFRDVVQTISSLCVAFVTIFTFYKTHVSWGIKEVKASKETASSKGEAISFFLKNESLMPRTIRSVDMLVDNHYIIKIKSYETPLVINPYSYQLVELRYTYIQKKLDETSPLCDERISYIISTPEKFFVIDYKGKIIDRLSEVDFIIKYQNLEQIKTYSLYFNNNVISSIDQYGVVAESDGIKYYYLIEQSGFVDATLPWHENMIQKKHLYDKETLLKYFNSKIAELKTLDFKIVQIVDFRFSPKPKWVIKQNEAKI